MNKRTSYPLIMLLITVSIASMLSISSSMNQPPQQQLAFAQSQSSDLKQGVKQQVDEDNLCHRSDGCKQANEGQQITGQDNSATGFNDQSNNTATATATNNNNNPSALPPGPTDILEPPQLPSQVTGLSATPAGCNQITLSWNPNPANEQIAHYNVYRGTTPDFAVNTATDSPIAQSTTTTYTDTGLSASITYYYKVAAVNSNGGIGPLSTVALDTTNAGQPQPQLPEKSITLGFESGSPSTGWEWGKVDSQSGTTDRLVAVDKNSINPPSIDPCGAKALKVTVQPTDISNNGARAEVVLTNPLSNKNTYHFLPGEEVWYHWYTMFPSDLTIPNSWHYWTQFHQEADSSTCNRADGSSFSPCFVVPMGFNFQNYPTGERIEFDVINKYDVNDFSNNPSGKGSGHDILWSEKLQKGHWYDMLLHVKWEPCKTYSADGTCTDHNGGFVERMGRWQTGCSKDPSFYYG